MELKVKEYILDVLHKDASHCRQCPSLCDRLQVVWGEGNLDARIVLLGEAPGHDEEETGRPFTGRSGQLLRKLISFCGWKEEDLYILNCIKCRPNDNRTPTEVEMANCFPYLAAQLAIIDPQYIICLGKTAAFNLLKPEVSFAKFSIGSYRKEVFQYGAASVFCTYHPAFVLRNPIEGKKEVKEDLLFFSQKTGIRVSFST